MFEHSFFKNKPAIASLKEIADPKPDHLRACILELSRHMLTKESKPRKLNEEAKKAIRDVITRVLKDEVSGEVKIRYLSNHFFALFEDVDPKELYGE